MLPLRIHNLLDYLIGALLIVTPWLFGFPEIQAARTLFLISGIGLIGYSVLTNYYYSVARVIPLGTHMTLDTVLGLFMILSPALFGYRESLSETQYAVHIALGIGLVGFVAVTRPRTEASKTSVERAAIVNELTSRI